jgi:transketolase
VVVVPPPPPPSSSSSSQACTKRVAIEAGVSGLWYKYVGLNGKVIGTDKFGFSAPGDTVMKEFGITKDNLVAVAKTL